jgi:hypothetical protein
MLETPQPTLASLQRKRPRFKPWLRKRLNRPDFSFSNSASAVILQGHQLCGFPFFLTRIIQLIKAASMR